MPISRYQIRNPNGLSDPELYRSADRDDPEAILEGVAMAGLVGILRQLGDLAEFAAEIFHDLHEEVLATATRGHGLMIRVQQVEAEFPTIEKALLSQTIHSNFTKNAGVEWHANLKMEHNLITTGDMPRFIMDSYEECRGPPRLFLLDKFDIAGAGACLKRYSDPSFFKTEYGHSKKKKAEVQKEIKARKIKKRGAHGRNGDTLEMFSTPHFNSTLRQLFSDEGGSPSKKVPIHAVKLKRKHLNGSSFNSVTGRSYMECVLETSSPKHDTENYECNTSELASDMHEISKEDLTSNLLLIDRTWISSPNGQEILESSLDELVHDMVKGRSFESLSKSTAGSHEQIPSSTLPQISKKYVTDSGESRMEAKKTQVVEISSSMHQADEKDESLKDVSKMEDGGDKTELDKLSPSYLQVRQKGVLFDIKSKIEFGSDGYRSAESEAEKNNAMIYPEDQRDEFDDKSEAEAIGDGYEADDVDRNSSVIHLIREKESSDGKNKTEANDDECGSDDADRNHAVISTSDYDGYGFDDAEKYNPAISPLDQKDSLFNVESKSEASDNGYGSDDAASELDNYMDALTTMESEMETDTESRVKHERFFLDVVTKDTYLDMNEKRHDVHPNAHPVEDSNTSYDLNSLLTEQRLRYSDSSSNLADMQVQESKGIVSTDALEQFNNSPQFEDPLPGSLHGNSSFVFPDKSPSPSNGDVATELFLLSNVDLTKGHDDTPDELTTHDDPGAKSPESFIPSRNNNEISEVSHLVSESGETSCSSCITDAAVATLIHSSSSASLTEGQLIRTAPSEISSFEIGAIGNHPGYNLLPMPDVSSHHHQTEYAGTAPFANSSSTCRMLDGEDHNICSDSGMHSSDISDVPQGIKDAGAATFAKSSSACRMLDGDDHNVSFDSGMNSSDISDTLQGTKDAEACSAAARLSRHLDVILGDLQASSESNLLLQTPENAVPGKALADDSSVGSIGDNVVMLDLPIVETSPLKDQLNLAKHNSDACSATLLPPECLSVVQTNPIDVSPCGLNPEKEGTGPHSSHAVDLSDSIYLPEHEQTSDILLSKSENPVESHNRNLEKADASAVHIEMETSLLTVEDKLCDATENKVKVVPVSLPLASPIDGLPLELSAHSDDVATGSTVGVSICNDGPTIDSQAPSDHPILLEEESLPTEDSSGQNKIKIGEPQIQEHNIALNGQNLTALSDSEANELLVHATNPAATAEPCHPDSPDLAVSEFLSVCHTMRFQDAIIHSRSSGDLDVSLLSKVGSQDLEQKLGGSNPPLGPKSPDQSHQCKGENDAVSPPIHFLSEPSIPPEQVLDAISSHDDSSSVDQRIQQISESKQKPESLVVVASSTTDGPAISSPDVSRSTKLKSEAQLQLPTSHYYQTSESPIKDEKEAVSPPIHFLSEPSIPPEKVLDAISSHDDSSSVDQLIQQISESKQKPESLVVVSSSITDGPAVSSPDVSGSTKLKSEAQLQLPTSHYYQTSESPIDLLDSVDSATPSVSFPSVGMPISEAPHKLQPNGPILSFLPSEPNLPSHEMELPPLPPLPPLEWRTGKLRHNSIPFGGQVMHSTNIFLPSQIVGVDSTRQPSNLFLEPQTVHTDQPKQPLSPFGLVPAAEDERSQGSSLMLGGTTVQPLNPYFPLPNVHNEDSLPDSQPIEEVREHPPNPSMLSVIVDDEKYLHNSQTSEDCLQQSVTPLMPAEAKEDQKANGNMQPEDTRLRDPLIEAVAAHDRSMLRKVSARFENETKPKSDERDSFLGQIRAKSFNLKPTTSMKPIIPGPRTNLNVVAILEKANAIRQAFAGSDEDDDSDSWSDS